MQFLLSRNPRDAAPPFEITDWGVFPTSLFSVLEIKGGDSPFHLRMTFQDPFHLVFFIGLMHRQGEIPLNMPDNIPPFRQFCALHLTLRLFRVDLIRDGINREFALLILCGPISIE